MPNPINTRDGWSLSPEIRASVAGGKLFERHREQEQIVPVTLELRVRKLNNVHGIGISWLVNYSIRFCIRSTGKFLHIQGTCQ